MGNKCCCNKETSTDDLQGENQLNPYTTIVKVEDTPNVSIDVSDVPKFIMSIITKVKNLVDSCQNKTELSKAIRCILKSLEPSIQTLKNMNSQLTSEPIKYLIDIVNKLNGFCEKITAENNKTNLWDKFKNVLSTTNDLNELINLNKSLTKALDDLKIPLQLEEIKQFEKMFNDLKSLMEKCQNAYNAAQSGKSVNILAKKFLNNEKAFAFWIGKKYYS